MSRDRMNNIIITGGGTGGHLMPALAIATALRERRPDLDPILVGALRGVEARILPERDFHYHLLPAEPIYRRQWWKNVRLPIVAYRVIRQVARLLDAERPVAVLGTGGYASAPVVWAAAGRGIPTAIQEQNAHPGLATRWLSRRVKQIYLGLPEARSRLSIGPGTEVFDTGNPIVPPDRGRRKAALLRFGLAAHGGAPVLLVMGGSQGALAINRAVAGWLDSPEWATAAGRPKVIWATGQGSYALFARYHSPPEVQVFDFLDPMADAYSVADLVVARAGMMTGAELCAWGLPSILIPLPTAAADHQMSNAKALQATGAARLLPQSDLTPEALGRAVSDLLKDRAALKAMATAALARGKPDAAAEIVSRLLTLF